MVTDPVGDLLIRIKNAYLAEKLEVVLPFSKEKKAVAELLKQYKFVGDVSEQGETKKNLVVQLKYGENGTPALLGVKRISTPGRRIYRGARGLRRVRGGFGVLIVSTPQGVVVAEEARKNNVGGEVLAEVW